MEVRLPLLTLVLLRAQTLIHHYYYHPEGICYVSTTKMLYLLFSVCPLLPVQANTASSSQIDKGERALTSNEESLNLLLFRVPGRKCWDLELLNLHIPYTLLPLKNTPTINATSWEMSMPRRSLSF